MGRYLWLLFCFLGFWIYIVSGSMFLRNHGREGRAVFVLTSVFYGFGSVFINWKEEEIVRLGGIYMYF